MLKIQIGNRFVLSTSLCHANSQEHKSLWGSETFQRSTQQINLQCVWRMWQLSLHLFFCSCICVGCFSWHQFRSQAVIVGWGGGPLWWAQSIDVQHAQSAKQGAREWPLGVVYKPCLNSSSAWKKPPTKQLGDTRLMTLIIYWNRTADSSWRNMLLNNLIVEELPISAISANILSNRHDFLTR